MMMWWVVGYPLKMGSGYILLTFWHSSFGPTFGTSVFIILRFQMFLCWQTSLVPPGDLAAKWTVIKGEFCWRGFVQIDLWSADNCPYTLLRTKGQILKITIESDWRSVVWDTTDRFSHLRLVSFKLCLCREGWEYQALMGLWFDKLANDIPRSKFYNWQMLLFSSNKSIISRILSVMNMTLNLRDSLRCYIPS